MGTNLSRWKHNFSNKYKWHRDMRIFVYKRDSFTCRECGYCPESVPTDYNGRYTIGELVLDHIKPVALGGLLENENLQTLCSYCNGSKGGR